MRTGGFSAFLQGTALEVHWTEAGVTCMDSTGVCGVCPVQFPNSSSSIFCLLCFQKFWRRSTNGTCHVDGLVKTYPLICCELRTSSELIVVPPVFFCFLLALEIFILAHFHRNLGSPEACTSASFF